MTRYDDMHDMSSRSSDVILRCQSRLNCNMETPKHDDLLAALVDLPPSKVEKFATALGVPRNVVEESQKNHPRNIYRLKFDSLSWWAANAEVSWEAVAKALEAKGVDERNLAKKIRGFALAKDGKKLSPRDSAIVLNIFLNCEETKSLETKQIHFKSLPTTPLEIKKKIEEDCSIPSCVQTLHYQSMILKDSDQLQHTHFRSGDTFTVNYPIEAECKVTRNVLKWLKQLFELLKSTEECIISPKEEKDHMMSSYCQKIENLVLEGEKDELTEALSATLFAPWGNKKKLLNCFYFHQEGGLDVLMKVYSILLSKEWGALGIDKDFHIFMENMCSAGICYYGHTFPLRRQVTSLGGLDMCTTALLRRQLHGDAGVVMDDLTYDTLYQALIALCSLSELPECQMPIAMRADVIDQILAIACCSDYEVIVSIVCINMIMCLAQSPGAHPYLVRMKVIEDLLQICALREKLNNELPQDEKEDSAAFKVLQCYVCTTLGQIGLGSPDLYTSLPLYLQQETIGIMSDLLDNIPPAVIRQYEDKKTLVWGTFIPFIQFLYKPTLDINQGTKERPELDTEDLKHKFHISCCNVLLHGLENALGRQLHLEILLKEGLLDYTMCLPAVLPGECQPRARSLVNELGKHRQLQPPSLCTLAKAHIAKTFCGLRPVMEMNSIGEFLHKFHKF